MSFPNLAQDFIDLFEETKRAHIAKYVHLHRPFLFDEIVNSPTYYIYWLETEIIKKHVVYFLKNPNKISLALELGPGSGSPVLNKTIPSIHALKELYDINYYCAVDIHREYSEGACAMVKKEFPDIKVQAVNLPMAMLKHEMFSNTLSKVIFCYGGTIFCNSSDEEITKNLASISALIDNEENFVFGLDISNNASSLAITYNNETVRQLLLNAMYGLRDALKIPNFDPTAFELVFEWHEEDYNVVLYLKATKNQNIIIKDKKIGILKGKKYNIINSRKSSIEQTEATLKEHNLKIIDVYQHSDRFGNQFAVVKTCKSSR